MGKLNIILHLFKVLGSRNRSCIFIYTIYNRKLCMFDKIKIIDDFPFAASNRRGSRKILGKRVSNRERQRRHGGRRGVVLEYVVGRRRSDDVNRTRRRSCLTCAAAVVVFTRRRYRVVLVIIHGVAAAVGATP